MEEYCNYYDCFIDDLEFEIPYPEIDCDLYCEYCPYRELIFLRW